MLNKEELQTRIAAICKEMEILKANYSKMEGHLQECNHWLQEMIKKESQPQGEENGEVNDEPAQEAA